MKAAIGFRPVGVVVLSWFAAAPALGTVSLQWRPSSQQVAIGETVNIGLYVVSNSEVGQDIIAADVDYGWDNLYLQFLGIDNTGQAANIERSQIPFPDVCTANEANPPADGNGIYICHVRIQAIVTATPEGALLTTFRFRGLIPTTAAVVRVLLRSPPVGGLCPSKVYDAYIPNHNILDPNGYGTVSIAVTGDLPTQACCFSNGSCSDSVAAVCSTQGGTPRGAGTNCQATQCPTSCGCPGDLDSNQSVDGMDIRLFVACATGGSCANAACADLNSSGSVESGDIQPFVVRLLSGAACP